MRRLQEPFRHTEDADGAGHVVVAAAGKGRRIIVGSKDDPLVDLARQLGDQVVGIRLEHILVALDAGMLTVPGHDVHGILHVDVDAKDLLPLAGGRSQGLLVDIPIRTAVSAREGDEPQSTVLEHVLIIPHVQGLIREHDMVLAKGER